MRSPEGFTPHHKPYYIENRYRVETQVETLADECTPSEVDVHEARHIVAAVLNGTEVLGATNIPDADSEGQTFLSRFDAVAAAAPHALGSEGTGSDMHKVHHFANADVAVLRARNLLHGQEDKVDRVAKTLRRKRKIDSYDIHDAISGRSEKQHISMTVEDTLTGERKKVEPLSDHSEKVIFKAPVPPQNRWYTRPSSY